MSEAAADPLVGCQINHYVIQRRLGQGGMGVVYHGRHVTLESDVAIKFLPAHLVSNADFVERFFREARAAAHLNHPNLISVHDAGTEGEVCYFVMEYVEGRDLSQVLKERNRFSEQEVLGFGLKVAAALAYAHKSNIIHRDIKPENLFLSNTGELKVGDLGLAKQTGDQGGSLTMSGMVVGTPFYISPEQIRGVKDIDPRTDIYSLGATLYHLVTGRVPYRGSSAAEIMAMHLNTDFPWPQTLNPMLSDRFCRLLSKMMAKDRKERFQTMDQVGEAIQACLEGRPSKWLDDGAPVVSAIQRRSLSMSPTPSPAPAPRAKSSAAPVMVVLIMLALLGGGGWYVWRYHLQPQTSPQTVAGGEKPPPAAPPKKEPSTPSKPPPPPEELSSTEIAAQLKEAVERGDTARAISLVEKGPETDVLNHGLRLAATHGRTEIARSLIVAKADVDGRAPNNLWTPLMNAASGGHTAVAELLLENGADANAQDKEHWTPLMLAAGKGHVETVKLLLDRGATINFQGAHGNTAFMQAVNQGKTGVVEFLIQRQADVNIKNERGDTALAMARGRGDNRLAQTLKSAGAQEVFAPTAAHPATTPGTGTGSKGDLAVAVSKGDSATVRALAKSQDGATLGQQLRKAVALGDSAQQLDTTLALLEAGADPNLKIDNTWTPFLYAVAAGKPKVIHLLLQHKAEVNTKSDDGKTALIMAAGTGNLDLVKFLWEQRADLNLKGAGGNTALMAALNGDQVEVAKFLIQKRVNVNAQNQAGETALKIAKRRNQTAIVDVLKQMSAAE